MTQPGAGGYAGVYRGMDYATYSAIPALNWSRLKPYLRSAAHGKNAEMRSKESDALTFGIAVHSAVLEPARFEEDYGTIPDDAPPKRSNEQKQWWADFYSRNKGRTMLDPDVLRDVRLVAEAIYAHPRAGAMLTNPAAAREVVAVTLDPVSGMWLKGRLDAVAQWKGDTYIVDIKTTNDAREYKMSRAMNEFDYCGQLAFYRRILNAVSPYPRSCAIIAAEKDPAMAVVYEIDEASLDVGDEDVDRAISTFTEAEAAGRWPGLQDGILSLPSWRLRNGGSN